MAHFFKFKNLDELRVACERLQIDIAFQDDLSPLFRPVQVGTFRVGNSLCVQPMEGCDGTLAGDPSELTIRRYQRFGAGGAKLIWGEAAAVVPEGRANSRQLLISDQTAPGLERMLNECRQAHRQAFGSDDDLLVGLQLTHSGRYSYQRPILACHDPLLDPRTIADRGTGKAVDESYPLVTDDDLKLLEDAYVEAAILAAKIGFQFIDVKQCHRYLLNELLAARTRPGEYGGSYENRTRFARQVIGRIRAEQPDVLIATRLGVFDSIPYRKHAESGVGEPCPWTPPHQTSWGTFMDDPRVPDLAEPRRWIADLVRLGVTLVNLSLGNPYASPHLVRPFEYPPPDGYSNPEHPLVGVARHFQLTAELQRSLPQVPMVGSGYSYLQEFLPQAGAANLARGHVTFVGVGRACLAQPDFARQLLEQGRLDRRRVCRTFSYCTALMRSKHNELGQFATGCPPFDREVYGPIWDAARR